MPLSDIAVGFAAALALLLFAWFFVGGQLNIRRHNQVVRWLQQGQPVMGEKTTFRWLGTTGVHLGINAAREPFKNVEILVLMEPRDVVPLWLLSYAQGRRDVLILRGNLRRHARVEFDLLDTASWSGKQVLARGVPDFWSRASLPDGMLLLTETPDAASLAQHMKPYLSRLTPYLRRVSVRRTVPHVELHLTAPWSASLAAADMLRTYQDIGKLLLPS